jgi:hypothetical protein
VAVLRRLRIGVIAGVVSALWASSAVASPGTMNPAGKIRGVVPAHGQGSKLRASNSNLSWHGGPVMQANAVYAIYWLPGYPSTSYAGIPSAGAISPNYEAVINRYFGDVAADSGKTSNVYWSDTQYTDGTGAAAYNSTFAGAIVDSNPFPASGCRDRYTTVCLTDAQLQAEIQNVVASGYPSGMSTEYFVFTPKNVGSCAGSTCAFSYYCAYHSQIGAGGSGTILYANMPYAAWVPSACGSGQSPNGDDADSTINVTSHEHNETITDPLGTAWYDRSGNEDGDKCAWNFGAPLGGASGAEYNQVINGHGYFMQQEWSNHSSGCILQGL